jgi:NADPH-dependent 7-cyano-7-deazaguanine reductase QueF
MKVKGEFNIRGGIRTAVEAEYRKEGEALPAGKGGS